jgi:pilus assembly protein CpaC
MTPVVNRGPGEGHRNARIVRGVAAIPFVLALVALVGIGRLGVAQAPATPAPPVPAASPAPANPAAAALGNPLLSPTPKTVGATPTASPESRIKQVKHVAKLLDPELTLDLVAGQTRVMVLKTVPVRVQSGDEKIMTMSISNTKELLLQGKDVGTTVLNLWFGDKDDPAKQETLSYLVRVYPDPEAKERLEKSYKQLEDEINKYFKDTSVRLKLLGDKLVVSGRVRDAQQGAQVLQIIRANMQSNGVGGSSSSNLGGGPAAMIPLGPAGLTTVGVGAPGLAGQDPLSNLASPSLDHYIASAGNNIVNLLEVAGEQQVALRVIVAEVSRAAARSIGLNFSIRNNQGVVVFRNTTGNVGGGGFGGVGAVANLAATLDGGNIPLAINALRTLSYAKSLAEPTLVTINGQSANFLAGGQFPVPIVSGFGINNGLQGVSFVPFGVQLNFTPFITDRDRIRLQLNANVSSRDVGVGTNIGGSNVAGLNTRNVNTVVELRQGETLAVAGLIESNHGADATRVPLFGDLPFLNPLSVNRHSAGEKELVIFVTPELVRPLEAGEVPPLPGADILEPTDIEFYLYNRLEGRVGPYRSSIRTDWGRIRHFEKVERALLNGPSGYCPAP